MPGRCSGRVWYAGPPVRCRWCRRPVRGVDLPLGAEPDAAIADRQRHAIGGSEARVVAGAAGNVAVPRQDRVVEQKLPQRRLGRIDGQVVGIGHRRRNRCRRHRRANGRCVRRGAGGLEIGRAARRVTERSEENRGKNRASSCRASCPAVALRRNRRVGVPSAAARDLAGKDHIGPHRGNLHHAGAGLGGSLHPRQPLAQCRRHRVPRTFRQLVEREALRFEAATEVLGPERFVPVIGIDVAPVW